MTPTRSHEFLVVAAKRAQGTICQSVTLWRQVSVYSGIEPGRPVLERLAIGELGVSARRRAVRGVALAFRPHHADGVAWAAALPVDPRRGGRRARTARSSERTRTRCLKGCHTRMPGVTLKGPAGSTLFVLKTVRRGSWRGHSFSRGGWRSWTLSGPGALVSKVAV